MKIGLTGGIASGKSTVSAMLHELGAEIVDADLKAREVVAPGTDGLAAIVARFGDELLDSSGALRRKHLGAIVFADAELRAQLNAIVHPRVLRAMLTEVEALEAAGAPLIVLDVPLLFESRQQYPVDTQVLVWVDPATQLQRLQARDSSSEDEARARIDAQMPLDAKRALAEHVIDNSGSLAATRRQVEALVARWTPSSERGLLFSFEGIDGCGKSTQLRRLEAALKDRGWPVLTSFEPSLHPHGRRLRELAEQGKRLSPEAELELFLLDRRQHRDETIEPALAAGRPVLIDRYYHSSIAYQGARGLDPARVRAANEAFAPAPDRIYLFDTEIDICLARIAASGRSTDAFETRSWLERVQSIYRTLDDAVIVRLDAALPQDMLAERILADALALLSRR